MFHMSEISPYSQRIAFSDGKNICVYDCTQKVLVAKTPHHGKLEGIWWVDDKNLILGIGLLSGTKSFSFFSIEKQTLTEATSQLMSHWTSDAGGYSNPNWFRPAITTVKVLEK